MVEVDKAAEFRKLKKLHAGEEDPIIIAQRFLNIFRQLHIFNADKKADFNKMLLELPPYIRGMFNALPGGGVLQDYVDDLAEKGGYEKGISAPVAAAAIPDEEASRTRILVNALAEANAAQMQNMANVAAADGNSAPMFHSGGSAKLEMSANFAGDLAKALAQALQNNNLNGKDEIRTMVQALGQTQLEIVKVLHSENIERKQESEQLTTMLTQAQGQIAEMLTNPQEYASSGGVTSAETNQLIKTLADSQAQIAEALTNLKNSDGMDNSGSAKLFELSQQQFVRAVDAINESGRQNSQEIARAISESQQQLANMMIQQNNQRIAAATTVDGDDIKINAADYLTQLNQIADKFSTSQSGGNQNIEKTVESLVKAQLDIYREVASSQAKELSSIISIALKESQEISTKNLIKALENLPKTTVVEKTITVPQPVYMTAPMAPVVQPTAESPTPASGIFSALAAAVSKATTPPKTLAPIEEEATPVIDETETIETVEAIESSDFSSQPEILADDTVSYDEPVLLDEPEESEPISEIAEQTEGEAENDSFDLLNSTEDSDDNLSELFSIGEDPTLNADEISKPKKKKKKKKKNRPLNDELIENENVGDVDFDVLDLPEGDNSFTFPEINEQDDNPDLGMIQRHDELPHKFDWQDEAPAEITLLEDDYSPLSEDILAGIEDVSAPTSAPLSNENEWGFDTTEAEPVSFTPVAEQSENWGWEPEATPAADVAQPSTNAPIDDQDWEWEYEEVPEGEAAAGEESQDWEWEYEEVHEGETASGEEGQDWEWEYEEVPEGEAANSNGSQPAAATKQSSNW